jgi:hypothetical protein
VAGTRPARSRKANLWKADRKVRLAESESAWKIEQVTTE